MRCRCNPHHGSHGGYLRFFSGKSGMMRLTVGIHRGIIHHVVILSSHVFSPMPGYLQRAVDRIVTCTQMVKVKEHHFRFEHDSRIQKIHVSHHYLCFSAIITILIYPLVSVTQTISGSAGSLKLQVIWVLCSCSRGS